MEEIYKAADEFVECMQILWAAEEDWLFSQRNEEYFPC